MGGCEDQDGLWSREWGGELCRHGERARAGEGEGPSVAMQVGASWEESGLAWPSARELRVLSVQAGPPLWVTDFSEGIGERTVSTGDPSPEPPRGKRC